MRPIHWVLVGLALLLSVAAAGHALLYKRDPRAAFGWIAICLLFPAFGPLLYFLLGVNRVRTRARALHRRRLFHLQIGYERGDAHLDAHLIEAAVPPEFTALARIADAVAGQPLAGGNAIAVLHNGEQAYPAMLEAIASAQRFVFLASYIFDADDSGRRFVEALAAAQARGVDVRVVVDGVGERYSRPRIGRLLAQHDIPFARFLPPRLWPPALHVNLRNHRKILVVDGEIAFTGGMNIGDRHLAARTDNRGRVIDLHFRLQGPVAGQITALFLRDWTFCTGEERVPQAPRVAASGTALARVIADGPNEDLGKLATLIVGAVSAASRRIAIMTPYFLPSPELIAALQAAALRGVEVVLVLPARNNLPFVHWATRNLLWQVLQWGVRVYYQPPPFVHSKLFIVDDHYALVGSANLDPRSLRLNFEMAVEIYDTDFVTALADHVEAVRSRSREVGLAEVDGRGLLTRTRDALAWLFSPYL